MTDLHAGHVYIAPLGTEPGESGWTDIGETLSDPGFKFDPQVPGEPAWQPWPRGPVTASVTVPMSEATGEQGYLVLGPAWLIWRSPDGRCFEGEGPDVDSAIANARRKWRGRPLPLAVNGHEYHRRSKARQGRNRR